MPRPKNNKEMEGIRCLIQQHLQRQVLSAPPMLANSHLDEDALNAFVEGSLSETESSPVIKHLVACSLCRHTTTQLVRLDSEIGAEGIASAPVAQEEPGRIRRLLTDLAGRAFLPAEEDAVLAYHAPEEDSEREDEAKDDEENAGATKPPMDSQ